VAPEAPRVERIVSAFIAKLQAITTSNGYFTDLGTTLLVNEIPQLGPDDPSQVLVLLIGDDEQTFGPNSNAFLIRLPLTVIVLVDASVDTSAEAWQVVERGIADVKRAVEDDDGRTLGGVLTTNGYLERGNVERIPREGGSGVMGAVLPYAAPYKEGWGRP
jgi:hypothetical protein